MIPEPGLYPNLSREDYDGWEAANFSTIKHMERSPAHALVARDGKHREMSAQILGKAIHCALLEPNKYEHLYVEAPEINKRSKAGKEEWAEFQEENKEKQILSHEDFLLPFTLRHALFAHRVAREFLDAPGPVEISGAWHNIVLCKARFDKLCESRIIIDPKSALDASHDGFERAIARYRYHIQAAFYKDAMQFITGDTWRFLFVPFEKVPPFAIACYEPDDLMLEQGRADYLRYLQTYADCERTHIWPSYPEEIQPVSLPNWALNVEDILT